MTNLVDLNGTGLDTNLSYPYQALQAVINATWDLATTKSSALDAKLDAANADFLDVTTTPTISADTVDLPTISAPGVTIPAEIDVEAVMAKYGSQYLELGQWLVTNFEAFIEEQFPNGAETYTAGDAWLRQALNDPSGLPPAVKEQLLEEDRSRELAEASRAADSVISTFAARRYPLPPGAAASAILQVQQKSQDAMAAANRKVMVMSIENLRFAVEKAQTYRTSALGAAIDYVKALASGPEMATRAIGVGYDAQSKLISAASQFYLADTQAKEAVSKVSQFNVSSKLEAASKNQAAELTIIEDKLKALLMRCQTLASEATSLFNNLHASVGSSGSVSKSDSTTLDLTP